MKTDSSKSKTKQTIFALLTLFFGILLLIYMIIVEDEPGAIPLLLFFAGAGWLARIRYRQWQKTADIHK